MFLLLLLLAVGGLVGWYFLNENVLIPQKLALIDAAMAAAAYDKAMEQIQELPESTRDQGVLYWYQYKIQFQAGQYVLALQHLDEALKKGQWKGDFTELNVHLAAAEIYETMQRPKKAIEEYDAALLIQPDHPLANAKIGGHLFGLKNFGAAKPHLLRALESLGEAAGPLKELAEIALHEKNHEGVIDYANRAIAAGQTAPWTRALLCQAYLSLGKDEQALAETDLGRTDPAHGVHAELVRGIALCRLGRHGEAHDCLDQGLVKMAETVNDLVLESRYHFAAILAKKGDFKEAIRQLNLVRNSGGVFADANERITVMMQILSTTELIQLLEPKDLDAVLKDRLSRALSAQNYTVNKTVTPGNRRILMLVRKSAAGQNLRQMVAVDLSTEPSEDFFARACVDQMNRNETNTGVYFALFGPSKEAADTLRKAVVEITQYSIKDFEAFLKGNKGL